MLNALYPTLRAALFALEPERAHALTLAALNGARRLRLLRAPRSHAASAVALLGLSFANRVGLAAGFDKNGRCIDALGALGFGFLEIGTVTLRPQSGQPQPRLFRLPAAAALINRMGFPNEGAQSVAARLARRTFAGVCGVNIGKNAATPLSSAIDDYVGCFRIVAPHADYVAINVSSPNTQDLRRLQEVEQLRPMLAALLDERERLRIATQRRVSLLVKVSPDVTDADLTALAELIRTLHIDGVIATNTTLTRPGLSGLPVAEEAGGLSGAPLRPLATHALRILRAGLGPATPLVAVGGIHGGADARAALQAGADLVQLYTGLIYRGPGLVREVRDAITAES
jgi:dihydroorotate dehydrogenase